MGDGNGAVDADEVDAFEANAISGLNIALSFGSGGFAEFGQALREIATIDGSTARVLRVDDFNIEGAEGSIGSTAGVRISFQLHVEFPDVGKANRHAVSVARAESGLQVADRIVVRPADGWRIKEDSIQPSRLQAFYDEGRVSGSQRELEGPEPLTFDLEKKSALSPWGWFLAVSLLLILIGAGLYLWHQKRRKV
jgi:hypothetical protein